MIDVYTLLLFRVAGTGTLAIIAFVAFFLFYFSGENGTGRLFGIVMLLVSMFMVMLSVTSIAVIYSNSDLISLNRFFVFWARETIAVWLANITIIILGIYLLKRK